MPARCPKCGSARAESAEECARCGVVFRKYLARHREAEGDAPDEPPEGRGLSSGASATQGGVGTDEGHSPADRLRRFLLPQERAVNPLHFAARVLTLVGLAAWSLRFLSSTLESAYAMSSFLHGVNLAFHEAGHILFRPFGRFLTVLGGSLLQLLMPAICAGAFVVKERNAFGASVATWWVAENLLDIAPYVNDARALVLPLLGGVTGRDVADYHDWQWLLGRLGLLQFDHGIALAIHGCGVALMVASLVWGGVILRGQAKNIERDLV